MLCAALFFRSPARAEATPAADRTAPAATPTAHTTASAPTARQLEGIRRDHVAGITGLVMMPTGAAMLAGGIRVYNNSFVLDPRTGRYVSDSLSQSRLGMTMVVVGTLATAGGGATVAVSTLTGGTRLHRIDDQHRRTAGWLALASVPVWWSFAGTDLGSALGPVPVLLGVGGLVAGEGIQFAQNARAARSLGALPPRRGWFSSLQLTPTPSGLQVAGQF